MNLLKSSLLATALLAAGASPAFAGPTTTFDVTITILKTCDVDFAAATNVAFGGVVSTAINANANGSLSVRCTPLTPYNIALDYGDNGTTVSDRSMREPGGTLLPYQLYKQATYAAGDVWGDTVGTNTNGGTGTGALQVFPVYGRVPVANVPAGVYSDTVTATILY